ncbi:MAG: FkbM family methyltransferase [Proteobacteria bacterium]|nr:FkbM family methyltransferase [Pseudomonadota bacterium]
MATTVPSTMEEKLKNWLLPPRMYIRHRALKELRRGEKELGLLPFLVHPDKVAVDVGANKGVWTWFLADLASRVYAYEPNPKLFNILKRNVAANVEAHQIALSDKDGVAELRVPHSHKGYSNQGASLSVTKVDGAYLGVDVEARRLDGLMLENVGFIKIDVEGFEAEVIGGALDTIRRDKPVMVVESEEVHIKRDVEVLLRFVEALGYETYILKGSVLTSIRDIDLDRYHRHCTVPADYIFNFIFLPG